MKTNTLISKYLNWMPTPIEWVAGIVVVVVFFSITGAMEQQDQVINAELISEAQASEQAATAKNKQESAALDKRSKYMTSYDQIVLSETAR